VSIKLLTLSLSSLIGIKILSIN